MNNENSKWAKPNLFKYYLNNYGGITAVLLIMVVATSIMQPAFLRTANLLGILANANDVFLVAFGMTFVILSGGIDLSQGSLAAMSGMLMAMLLAAGIHFIPAIIITVIVGAICGILNGVIISRANVPPFVVTLGTMGIFRGLAMTMNSGYAQHIDMENPFIAFANGRLFGIPNVLFYVAVAFLICHFILHKTNSGRNVYAIGGNKEAAKLAGISVVKTSMFTYAVCSALVAFAGLILAGRMFSGLPSASVGLETRAVAAVILGGTSFTGGDGKIFGTIIGVLILSVLINAMVLFGLGPQIQQIVQGVIIIVAVVYDGLRRKSA